MSGSFQDQGPIARDDADQLAAGDRGPATGNLITGAGTETGAAGADTGAGARVTAVTGPGGQDTSFTSGQLRVDGEHGVLSVTARGDYVYRPNPNVPENSRDTFTYTLSDQAGSSQARLTIEIGKTQAVVSADAQRVVPGPDGVVVLPAGVELSDIRIVGRDLLVMLPDGSQMLIVDGAVFVPQLVINDIEVPSTNLAALLIEQEPRPASGVPQSSGGNFAAPVGPLDPGTPLGDLLPPTQLDYTPPEFRETALEEDLKPEVGANPLIQMDDDARPGGNAGGTGDDVDAVNVTGTLSGSGGDGQLTFALSTVGAPAGFAYVAGPNGSLLVQQNGVTVLTVTVNAQTGAYTVVQNAAISHAAGSDENNVSFTFGYTVTDRDGDVASGTFEVNVDDDTPLLDVAAGADAGVVLTTDDADTRGELTDSNASSANFGGVFSLPTNSVGADGLGTAAVLNYALGTPGGASGLTQGGAAINLFLIGGKVVGSTAATAGAVTAANTVFDVSVASNGVVTLTQYSQIDHAAEATTTSPFNDQFASLADGLVTLTASATLTDRDGDTATDSATVQIGANLRFSDDGPSMTGATAGAGVTLDETTAVTPAGFPISATSESAVIVAGAGSFGADGAAATGASTYAISVVGGGATQLRTAQGDFPISLVQTSASVITGTYVEGGVTKTAFTVTIGADGRVTVQQSVALEHNIDGSTPAAFDDALDLSGLINASITLRDFDGDTASATTGIGNLIVFKDDGPDSSLNVEAARDTLILDETQPVGSDTSGGNSPLGLASVTADFSDNFAAAKYGADGAGSVAYSLVLSGSSIGSGLYALDQADVSSEDGDGIGRGAEILLSQSGDTVTGSIGSTVYFTITVNAQTGVVTFTQVNPIWHPVDGTSYDEAATLTAALNALQLRQTVTDSDGDSDASNIDLSRGVFQIQDDGPIARPDVDDIGAGAYGPETGNVLTNDTQGRDGAKVVQVDAGVASDSSFNADGNLVIQGQYGVLTIAADGSYSYQRNAGTPGGVSDVFTYTLRDTDGDTSQSTLTIRIGNLPPTINAPDLGAPGTLVDEKGLPVRTGEPEGSGEEAAAGANGDTSETTSGQITYTEGDSPAIIKIGGVEVTGAGQNIDTGEGILTINSYGNGVITYSYTLKDNQLVPGSSTTDVISVEITDKDGQSVSDTLTITIVDDAPIARDDTDEIAAGSNGPAVGNVITGAGTTSVDPSGKDTVGADNATLVKVVGVTSDEVFDGNGNLVVEGEYGILTIKADGSYSYARNPGTPGGVEDVFTYTLKDSDGDEDTATLTITIGNAVPVAVNASALLDDDGLAGANTAAGSNDINANNGDLGAGSPSDTEAVFRGQLQATGGDGDKDFALVKPADGLTIGQETVNFTLVNNVLTAVIATSPDADRVGDSLFTVTLDSETGDYTVQLLDNVLHGDDAANDEDGSEIQVAIGFQVIDVDGSVSAANGILTVTFNDDVPTASIGLSTANPEPVLTTQDAETDGVPTDTDTAATTIDFGSHLTFANSPGADGLASATKAFSLSVESATSELSSGGQPIFLYRLADGTVVGSTSNSAVTSIDATAVFSLSVSASTGVVTVMQYKAVDHALPGEADGPYDDQFAELVADKVNLDVTYTVIDRDGDTVVQTTQVDLGGNIRFADDGPTASNVNGGTFGENAPVIIALPASNSFGADGPAASGALTFTQPAVGSVSYNAATNSFTYTPPLGGVDGTLSFTYTLKDYDGDTVTKTVEFTTADDSIPTVTVTSLTVDEKGLPARVGEANSEGSGEAANAAAGSDQSEVSALGQMTIGTGGDTLAKVEVRDASNNWIDVTGGTLATPVLVQGADGVLSVYKDASGNYVYFYTLTDNLENHPDNSVGDGDGDRGAADTLPGDSFGVRVTDSDGSLSPTSTINVTVRDDGPSVTASTTQPMLIVDETVLATNATASFASVFTPLFGADGGAAPVSTTYALGFNAGATGLTDTATGAAVVLSQVGSTIVGTAGVGGPVVFVVSVNAAGEVTLDQQRAVVHNDPTDPDEAGLSAATLASDNLITLTATVTDGDGDSASATANIGQNLQFKDDGPSVTASTTQPMLIVDETALATNATASFASVFTPLFGADGAAAPVSTTYALGFNAGATGLTDTATGAAVVLSQVGSTIVGTAGVGGPVVFVVSVNAAGEVTLDQQRAVVHNDPTDPDEAGLSAATLASDNLITLTATVTDGDGDSASATANIGQNLQFKDDGPAFTTVTSPLLIANSGNVANTGSFGYNLGADGAPADNDVIKSLTLNGVTVNNVAATNLQLVAGAETATSATYNISFTYPTGTGTNSIATGTLVINKTNGTYTVDLDAPIQSFTILDTGSANASAFVESSPQVTTAALSNNFFVQFTGQSAGNGNFTTLNDPLDLTPANDGQANALSSGELLSAATATVQVSSTAAGVAGNTLQGSEILNFNLYATNPGGTTGLTPTTSSSSMFLVFDGVGSAEDLVVNLRLFNPNTGEYTTRAIVVQNSDLIRGPRDNDPATAAQPLPAPYQGIRLDNNDAFVVIEANDYNINPGDNFVIVGGQIAGSETSITGLAIDLNSAIGASGGSSAILGSLAADVDSNAPIKIISVGFLTQSSTAQSATLDFTAVIQDGDGDTASTNFQVVVGAAAPAAVTTQSVSMMVADETLLASDSGSSGGSNKSSLDGLKTQGANNNIALMAGLAAGFAAMPAAASTGETFNASLTGQPLGDTNFDWMRQAFDQNIDGRMEALNASLDQASLDIAGFGDPVQHFAGAEEMAFDPSLDGSEQLPVSLLDQGTEVTGGPADHSALFGGGEIHLPAAAQMALVSGEGLGPVQGHPALEAILLQALDGQGTGEAELDALIGAAIDLAGPVQHQGGSEEVAVIDAGNGPNGLASPLGHGVSGWDGGDFSPLFMATSAAMESKALHPDAVQPIANG